METLRGSLIARAVVLALVAVAGCTVTAPSAETSKGTAAYHRGDYQTAFREFWKPASEGDRVAQFGLGVLYYHGRGVPMNRQEARDWYRRAAQQGYDRAQSGLAIMCLAGDGGVSDPVEAYMWLILAAAQGQAEPRKASDDLAQRLTPQQREAARKWAHEWEPNQPGLRC